MVKLWDMYQSTITSWALLLAKAIDQSGHSRDDIFHKAGLDITRLRDPNERYSYRGMTRLWKLAAQVTGDPCIGIKAAGYWHPTTLHALGYSWMASSSLKEAIERTIRYLRIVSTATGIAMEQNQELVYLKFAESNDIEPAPEAFDAALAVLVNMCKTSYGEGFRVEHVFLRRQQPACSEEFKRFFNAPISFGAAQNAISFFSEDLEKTLPTANAELVRVNDQIIAEHLAQLDKTDIISQVKMEVIRLLPSGDFSEQLIAENLNTSLRSLQRKLTAEGISYKVLLDDIRNELAVQYMRDSRHPINEITYLLGFSEPSNFSRAFKRWTGQSPSAFRSV